jgi:hypothetical protein
MCLYFQDASDDDEDMDEEEQSEYDRKMTKKRLATVIELSYLSSMSTAVMYMQFYDLKYPPPC